MKVLCLHGMGTNADIFKAQTAAFRSLLSSHVTFDFLEGENECPAADGVGELFPAPYFCWYQYPPNLDRVADAHEMIETVIEEDGPFDGIMGFSQGAALAASILLHHEIKSSLEPSPFRFAVFICASLPFSTSDDYGFDLAKAPFIHGDPVSGDVEEWKRLVNEGSRPDTCYFSLSRPTDLQRLAGHDMIESPGSAYSPHGGDDSTDTESDHMSPETPATPQSVLEDDTESKKTDLTALNKETEIFQRSILSDRPVRRFHPTLDKIRISIPTAHVYGSKDPYFKHSLQLVNLCQKNLVNVLDHGGAHDVPRSEDISQAIASMIENTISKSEFMF